MSTPVDELLEQIRHHFNQSQTAINTLVRGQVAKGLAAEFMERSRPYDDDALLSTLLRDGLLSRGAFPQKTPALLRFYARLLPGLHVERALEIGVKGGGSTAFWKQLFPAATVVGLDADLRPRLGGDQV